MEGRLLKQYIQGEGGPKVVIKSTAGPSSYSTGGFEVTVGELENVEEALVVATPSQIAKANDTVYSYEWSVSGNVVTIKVYTADFTGTSPVAWSELTATTDIHTVTFHVIAWGE